jgi:dTMP kinase
MNFIVIEGLDGSGKSTQIQLLQQHIEKQGLKYKYLHFPRTCSPIYGELVARFLRGELGDNDKVNPYLVALIYAGDRNDAKPLITQWLSEGYFIILDRYVHSNIAFQCAKLKGLEEKKILKEWIFNLEFTYNGLPKPDLNLFLDVPFQFTENKLKSARTGDDRNYLNGQKDIHEEDLGFQSQVRKEYVSFIADPRDNFKLIDCSDGGDRMLVPDEIFEKIKSTVKL